MAANSGYLEQTTNPTLGTSYVGAILAKTAADGGSVALPSSGAVWSHLEVIVTGTTTASIDAYISCDTTGDDIAAGPTQASVTLVDLPGANRKGAIITLDNIVPRTPSADGGAADQTTVGALKVWIKCNAGTPVLTRCRMHWYLATTRGG